MKHRMFLLAIFGMVLIGAFVMSTSGSLKQSSSLQVKTNGDWEATIDVYADGHTYCIIGEKQGASDGVDSYDVPHPPFMPPGRAFVFIKQPSFQDPYKNLWMEWRHYTHTGIIWNLTTFYYPMDDEGSDVLIQWTPAQFSASGYGSVVLCHGNQHVNMLTCSSYSFYSEPFQMTSMKIYCAPPVSVC